MGSPATEHVVLLATGGTIASRTDAGDGSTVAADAGGTVLAAAGTSTVAVEVVDLMQKGSYLLTFDDMLAVCGAIRTALAVPETLGIVVTHGTDTMEETAYLADLLHDDPRPVVFTGAQRAADSSDPDGPGNLRAAITLAASAEARGRGALIVFDGEVLPLPATRKTETTALHAFSNPDLGPVGSVSPTGEIDLGPAPERRSPLAAPPTGTGIRVDIIACYPGADATLFAAALAAGARGIVLEATGLGNANAELGDAVRRAVRDGVVVVTSTRVHAGPVRGVYGAGGGRTLEDAGAVPSGLLRPSQVRTLLQALLALGLSGEQVVREIRQRGDPSWLHSPTDHSPISPLPGKADP
ncbi:asparaginase [Arthrobacter agilis]|uniref:asparaginase n=1 Tax=Arthrobacter agilis TaxID=37921 RepID=UPI00277E7E29|nr:asparaginase [Arthrobacter agilis]MDQ0733738.1 L-asparaginase [Arthrobacter agilis]